jgi:hypothetical protein
MRRKLILLMFMLGMYLMISFENFVVELLTLNLVAMSCCSMNCVGALNMDLGIKRGRNSIVAMKAESHFNVGD